MTEKEQITKALSQVEMQLKMSMLMVASSVFHGTGASSEDIIKLAKELKAYASD